MLQSAIMVKQKNFRIEEEILNKFLELKTVYNAKSDNQLFELIVEDIYQLKKSKALVPYEEVDKRDVELKKLYFELGKLKTELEQKEKELEKEKNKSFWAKLLGR